jgi:hypothetical protein
VGREIKSKIKSKITIKSKSKSKSKWGYWEVAGPLVEVPELSLGPSPPP